MRVCRLQVRNFRSFSDSGAIELGNVTVLVGPNNAGKSTLIKALSLMQQGFPFATSDVRIGADLAQINVSVADVSDALALVAPQIQAADHTGEIAIRLASNGPVNMQLSVRNTSGAQQQIAFQFPSQEPANFIVPYFAQRKTSGYSSDVNESLAMSVSPTLQNLPAKLQRVANPDAPGSEQYRETCKQLLGYVVTAIPDQRGVMAAAYVSRTASIPISAMGEGVPNIVGLLAELALAERKLFLIEEPENDVHPQALKALLDLIARSSATNQFVVSTHSHIVVRHLAALEGSRLYHVSVNGPQLPPVSTIRVVGPTPSDRLDVLTDLGYELYDFDLWDGWLILEEASAERIIRDILIPEFVPRLARIRTLAAKGNSNVEPIFDDFRRLVLYTHLEDVYRDRAWVVIDGDEQGNEIVERLRSEYPSWTADRFRTLEESAFEYYYPPPYRERGEAALAIIDKQERRAAKRALVVEIIAWHSSEPAAARTAFEESAARVIELLHEIDQALFDPDPDG